MLIFTDAGYKEGVSSHGFVVKHWDGTVVKTHVYKGNESNCHESELMSIVSALNWIGHKRKGTKRQPRIYTDSLIIYEAVNEINNHPFDVSYIQNMMKQLNVKLFWRKRRHVVQAHELVSIELKSTYNRIQARKEKIKYKCEGSQRFKVGNKKKNKYKSKRGI